MVPFKSGLSDGSCYVSGLKHLHIFSMFTCSLRVNCKLIFISVKIIPQRVRILKMILGNGEMKVGSYLNIHIYLCVNQKLNQSVYHSYTAIAHGPLAYTFLLGRGPLECKKLKTIHRSSQYHYFIFWANL